MIGAKNKCTKDRESMYNFDDVKMCVAVLSMHNLIDTPRYFTRNNDTNAYFIPND